MIHRDFQLLEKVNQNELWPYISTSSKCLAKIEGKKKLWRKRNNFNKGYTPWNNKVQFELGVEADSSNAANIKVSRPKIEIYEAALTQHNGAANTLPTRLRPRRSSHKEKTEEQEDCSENIIVNFSKLKDFIKKCLKHRCRNTSKVDVAIAKRMGLCISLQANCEKCNFDTRACKVYTECEKKSRGPAAGYLHEAMTLAILKTKMGGTDLQMALACLNIKVPSLQLISTNVKKQCDKMIELNEAAMVKNQQFVQEFNQCIGKDNEVDVETDTAYNNRNQVGYEAGTQSFCPLIEKNTGLNLLMTMSTANKLCNRKNECCHTECKKTYSSEETISSSEGKLAEKNLQKMNDLKILKVKSVTSDASAQLSKVVREFGKKSGNSIRYYQCFSSKCLAKIEGKKKLWRKRNNFNKGYTPWNNKVQFELGVEADSSNAANIKVSRPKIEIYEAALTQHNGAANTLPTRLRPRRSSHKEKTEEQEDCSENIIVNFSKLKDFIKKCLKHRCRNTSKVDVAIAKRMGLCISLQANCEKCNFDTRACKVYTECEKKKQRTSCWLPP
ncbi:uncharacterized protein LOC134706018 [Mytilus trossulus]|uniref:uncharacterized protein LOC134706018 n=1 Tax=Mytilus trossulus TaxID=6551 RepID=UPI003004BAD4